jgi:hypothetical protein
LSLLIPGCLQGRRCARALASARRQGGCGYDLACRNSTPCIWRPGHVSPIHAGAHSQYVQPPFRRSASTSRSISFPLHVLNSIPCVLSRFLPKWYWSNICGTKAGFSCGRYGLVLCTILEQIMFSCCGLNLIVAGNSSRSRLNPARPLAYMCTHQI